MFDPIPDLPPPLEEQLVEPMILENCCPASGMVIVSGFVGEHHERHVEAAVAAPYPLGGDIALDGVWASEVMGGQECGIGLENFNDIKVGDTFESYKTFEVAKKLEG